MSRPLEDMGRYATVVIDPPWALAPVGWASSDTNGLERNLPYDLLSDADLARLPISEVLAEPGLLFCWTVSRRLAEAIHLLSEWGTAYWFAMTWVKNGGIQLPNSPMFNAEWVVVGRRGAPEFRDTRAFKTANFWPRGGHSEKPEGFYDLLRRVTPGPRLDIFGRRRIAGFDSWGLEAPDGPPIPEHYQEPMAI